MKKKGNNNEKMQPASVILKKVLLMTGRHKGLIFLGLIPTAASVVLQLYIPVLFGDAIDAMIGKGRVDFGVITPCLIKILILVCVAAVMTWVSNIINNRLAYRTIGDIRAAAIRRIHTLPLSYIDSHSPGDVVQRVIQDTDQLGEGLLLGFSQLYSGTVTIGVTLFFMFSRNVGITLMVLLMTPVSFLVARLISSATYKMFGKQTKTRGQLSALISEMIGNVRMVKAFGNGRKVSARFEKMNGELQEYSRKAVFYSSLTNPSTRAVNNGIYAIVALTGAFRIIDGVLSVGGLSVMLAYANQYMKPFNDISSVITELQSALACAGRVFELIEAEPEVPDGTEILDEVSGEVDIRNVAFSYDESRTLIKGFDFHASPGTMTAIVGPTGCGKTTLINLLMRFYDIKDGSIAVDKKDIRTVTRYSLRNSYGMVLQDTWLTEGTVRDNIAFGKPDASEDEIIKAAGDSHCLEFIRRLPNGLDTVIHEDSLSQGQKQLLCIARVMLCLPPMLILDEATSSIDTRTELDIQEAFSKLMKGRTSFIVAHRLSTVKNADRIIVMKSGSIIEQGTHTELLNKGGFYSELYNSQFAG